MLILMIINLLRLRNNQKDKLLKSSLSTLRMNQNSVLSNGANNLLALNAENPFNSPS